MGNNIVEISNRIVFVFILGPSMQYLASGIFGYVDITVLESVVPLLLILKVEHLRTGGLTGRDKKPT